MRCLAKRLPFIFQSVTCAFSSACESSAFPVQLYSFIKIVTTSTSLRSGSGSGCERFQAAAAAAAAERSKRQRRHATVVALKALSAVILHSRRRIATRFPNHLRQNRSSSSLARAICRCHALHTGRAAAWRLLAVAAICSPYRPFTPNAHHSRGHCHRSCCSVPRILRAFRHTQIPRSQRHVLHHGAVYQGLVPAAAASLAAAAATAAAAAAVAAAASAAAAASLHAGLAVRSRLTPG